MPSASPEVGSTAPGVRTVLFICFNNAGRSQIAEALFNVRAKERGIKAVAESAGLLGVGVVHPMVLRCITELEVDTETIKPKQLTLEMVARAEFIVAFTGVSGEKGPVKFEATEEWPMPDPAGLSYGGLCTVRDEIGERVDEMLTALTSKRRRKEADAAPPQP